MKGDTKVIEYLNQGLRHELTAVNQFWLHYRLFDNWGYNELAKKWRKESIEEMKHADRFVDRILFLEGFPNMQDLNPLRAECAGDPGVRSCGRVRRPQPLSGCRGLLRER